MPRKAYPNTEFSNRICATKGCTKKIKRRLVEKKNGEKYTLCYACWKEKDFNRRAVGTKR